MVKPIIIAYSIFFLVVVYYNNTVSKVNNTPQKTSLPPTGLTSASPNRVPDLSAGIQGFWNIAGEASAIFIIKNDRIIYPENEAAFPFSLHSDSMHIHYNDHEDVFSLSMQGPDTLVLTDAARHVYSRFKDAAANF